MIYAIIFTKYHLLCRSFPFIMPKECLDNRSHDSRYNVIARVINQFVLSYLTSILAIWHDPNNLCLIHKSKILWSLLIRISPSYLWKTINDTQLEKIIQNSLDSTFSSSTMSSIFQPITKIFDVAALLSTSQPLLAISFPC